MDLLTGLVILFDIDNTLTPPRRQITSEVAAILGQLRAPFHVVAGSHLPLVREQLLDPLRMFGFRGRFDAFVSNGADHYRCDYSTGFSCKLLSTFDLRAHLGESCYDTVLSVLNEVLTLPEFQLPPFIKVFGDSIVSRGSMINVSPIGRPSMETDDSHRNREAFQEFDRVSGYRRALLFHLKTRLAPLIEQRNLVIALGGQTSFDIGVRGEDKTKALRTFLMNGARRILFFGDALFPSGNDAVIREFVEAWDQAGACPVEAIQVNSCADTLACLARLDLVNGTANRKA